MIAARRWHGSLLPVVAKWKSYLKSQKVLRCQGIHVLPECKLVTLACLPTASSQAWAQITYGIYPKKNLILRVDLKNC